MQLVRAHGLGNDYLVYQQGPALDSALVRAICDRHTGVGSDGILEPRPPSGADYGVRIWNPDGSIAEKSGNGLRIFARWLCDARSAGSEFTVWTGFDVVHCLVGPVDITIEMGTAKFEPALVPHTQSTELRDGAIQVGDITLLASAVSMGNPHCVVFQTDPLDTIPWRTWGEALETHPWFPNRINVQVARVVDDTTIEARIWERGAGPTEASGSSSCAVVVAAIRTGRIPHGTVRVTMPGGSLTVEVRPDWTVRLIGPVEVVGTMQVSERWLNARIPTQQ